jgi:hypothetical protein
MMAGSEEIPLLSQVVLFYHYQIISNKNNIRTSINTKIYVARKEKLVNLAFERVSLIEI